jgi:hypothetical protein
MVGVELIQSMAVVAAAAPELQLSESLQRRQPVPQRSLAAVLVEMGRRVLTGAGRTLPVLAAAAAAHFPLALLFRKAETGMPVKWC